jgi:serine/threonine protein kinase
VNKESNALFANTSNMFELSQLERVKKLGVGTFGTVYLVQHAATTKLYAMKVIHKDLLFAYRQENNIYNERDIILALVDCQLVTALYATLQDAKSTYMILQYVPGGDLFSLLYSGKLAVTKLGGIPLPQALFYAGVVLSALTYMHDQEIVYRDLKPENLVSAAFLSIC